MNTGDRFTTRPTHGIVCFKMNELRDLRRAAELGQREFAAELGVALETFRTWDSGRRPVPAPVLQKARAAVAQHARRTEPLALDRLACELKVHIRTLQAAARTGRLEVQFGSKSVFGRPVRFATRSAGEKFIATHYRKFAGHEARPSPLVETPDDFPEQLISLRRRLRMTQGALAECIGAAGKAVVYQWESRKRTPSPIFWERIMGLECPSGASKSKRGKSHDVSI